MQIATNAAAGIHAAAGVARLQTELGVCAYPWPVATSRAGHSDKNVMITKSDRKFHNLHLRQPLEPSP